MSTLQKIVALGLFILVGAAGYGAWYTNKPAVAAARPGKAQPATDTVAGVDLSTFALAERLAPLADGPNEQKLAESAQRLADHELDVAFAAALRQIEAHPPTLSPEAQAIDTRLQKSATLLQTDQDKVTQLTAAVSQANAAQRGSLQNQLDLATTQLELDKDEVEEANQDLLEAGGNQHKRIEMLMQEHATTGGTHAPPPVISAATGPQGLVRRIQEWTALRRKQDWLAYAAAMADADVARLSEDRRSLSNQLEASKSGVPELAHHTKRAKSVAPSPATPSAAAPSPATPSAAAPSPATPSPATPGTAAPGTAAAGAKSAGTVTPSAATPTAAAPGATAASAMATHNAGAPAATNTRPTGSAPAAVPSNAPADHTALLETTRQISADQKLLTLLDQRIGALKQLGGVYRSWNASTATATKAALHDILQGATTVFAIILLLMLVDRWTGLFIRRSKLDRRQVETLRSVSRVALQILGVLIILIIIIGVPSQLGTMIGLAGAGLTVALKDFIVAFIGWLVLMGRNGLRLGDWVEINGVSGEVVQLGMFHTVLLETGNWTDSGHPTGRRVTFTNSFAIEKHYFNFSTSGQWLWDELLVLVPFDKDPNLIADAINREVTAATAESAIQAEQEWRRTAPGRRGNVFSATPGISVKPAVGGIEVSIRYITRASERFQLRSKLFQSAVRLLGNNSPQPVAGGVQVPSASTDAPKSV